MQHSRLLPLSTFRSFGYAFGACVFTTLFALPAFAVVPPDADRDGLVDADEILAGTDFEDPDTDKDGLSDGYEVHVSLTSPLVADTDGGGASDGIEVLVQKTNPKNAGDDPVAAITGGGLCATWVNSSAATLTSLATAEAQFTSMDPITEVPSPTQSYINNRAINYADGTGDSGGAFTSNQTATQMVWGSATETTYTVAFSGLLYVPPASPSNPQAAYIFAPGANDGLQLRIFDGTSTVQVRRDGTGPFRTGTPGLAPGDSNPNNAQNLTLIDFPDNGGYFPIELFSFANTGSWGVELSWAPRGTALFSSSTFNLLPITNTLAPDLRVIQSVTDINRRAGENVQAGDTLEILVRIVNNGPVPAYDVEYDAHLPSGFTPITSGALVPSCGNQLAAVGFCVPPNATVNAQRVKLDQIPVNYTYSIVYRVTVGSGDYTTPPFRLQGVVRASTTATAGIGTNRIIRLSDDTSYPGTVDSGNNPIGFGGQVFFEDGETDDDFCDVSRPLVNDNDGDGLDYEDEQTAGTDPNNPDTDGGGTPDGAEIINGTNPLDPSDDNSNDRDHDGLSDSAEEFYGTDPNDPDTDDDGLWDGPEIALGTDPRNPDTDGDGLKDGEEDANNNGRVDSNETDPRMADTDTDGLTDGEEKKVHHTNPLDPDTDDGGRADGAEIVRGTDPLDPSDDLPETGGPGVIDPGDGNGSPYYPDNNGDGFPDNYEITGGGCAGGPSSPLAALLVVFAIALLRARRNRGVLLALAVVFSAGVAQAQDTRSFAPERMRLAIDGKGILNVEYGNVPKHLEWNVGLLLGFENDMLVVHATDQNGNRQRIGSLIGTRTTAELVGAIALWDRLEIGLALPVILQQTNDDIPGATVPNLSSTGIGDLRLVPKLELANQEQIGVDIAVMLGVTLPTGGRSAYRGAHGVTASPELIVSRSFGIVRAAVNLGYLIRPDRDSINLRVANELYAMAGVAVRPIQLLELGVTSYVFTQASHPFTDRNETATEVDGFAQFYLPEDILLFAGAGAGVTQGFGAPDYRLFAGIRYAPQKREPPKPVEPPPPPPPSDRDGDGIIDEKDACPDVPETVNGFEDEDGCPDEPPPPPPPEPIAAPVVLDRDGDGVPDAVDNCPDVPGSPDFQGCPEAQRVRIEKDRLYITETVRFATGKAIIDKRSFALLNNIAAVLIAHPEIQEMEVAGHTDDVGSDASNLVLSQKRSAAVVAYLIKAGVAGSRLQSAGYGESRPIMVGTSTQARAANRRVEFNIRHRDEPQQ